MTAVSLLLLATGSMLVFMTGVFVVSQPTRNAGIVDIYQRTTSAFFPWFRRDQGGS